MAIDAVGRRGKTRGVDNLGDRNSGQLSLVVSVAHIATNVDLVGLIDVQLSKVGYCGQGIGAVPPGSVPETSLDIVPRII